MGWDALPAFAVIGVMLLVMNIGIPICNRYTEWNNPYWGWPTGGDRRNLMLHDRDRELYLQYNHKKKIAWKYLIKSVTNKNNNNKKQE